MNYRNRMNKIKQKTLLFFILLVTGSVAMAATSPVPMLKKTSNQLIVQLQKNKSQLKKNPQWVDVLVTKIVLPKIDKVRMARSVVSRQDWMKASTKERQQFVKQFQTLVLRTYASAFSEYTNEIVKFRPLRGALAKRNSVQVNSVIVRSGKPPIRVSYSMIRSGSNWKISDFSVEGVSMVQSFRAQLAGVNHAKLSGLTRFLKKHNAKKR